jgi:hypothetical protein
MMNRTELARAALVGMLVLMSAACGKKETKKPQASTPSGGGMVSSVPEDRGVTLTGVKLHAKVQFPEERLPTTQERADAIAGLASSIAGGSADALQSLIAERDKLVLDMLVKSGQWKRQADAVRVVRVCVINESSPGVFQVGLGVENAGGAFLMGWDAVESAGAWSFSNMAIEPRFASSAGGLDGSELKILDLPAGLPKSDVSIRPQEEEKDGGEEKKKPRPRSGGGGTLRKERN